MIKRLHYCWLGSDVPSAIHVHVNTWKEINPGVEIIEWNNANASYPEHPYWQQAATAKKWAFASDVVQLKKLYEYGGFYVDCDVQILKPLDTIPAPPDHLIMGYMYDGVLSGGFMYSPPQHPLVALMLEYYEDINPGFFAVNNTILTDCINANVHDILLNGRFYSSEQYKLTVFPKEYFCQPSFISSKPFLLDQFAGSWRPSESSFTTNRGSMGLYRIFRRKVSCFRSIMRNEFRDVYLNALVGRKLLRMEHWRTRYGLKGGAIKASSN
ncbi:MAG: hypothetical protein IKA23_04665 [Akkermansia sp.]|nr:hypothetical protein [Akkermansia sp.]MBR2313539.1 hypothetical protein [Akkermansia sp.]